jgi:hypothetical protein
MNRGISRWAVCFCLIGFALCQFVAVAADSMPKSVALVYPPSDTEGFEIGMLQVTFGDGHKEFFDKSDKCGWPQISQDGDVGWSVWTDNFPGRYGHSYEILRLRTQAGILKEFRPNSLFIQGWGFVDHDKAIAIASMAQHGSMSYIKYSVATGKVLGRVDDYVPYAELPKWAQPFSDEKP